MCHHIYCLIIMNVHVYVTDINFKILRVYVISRVEIISTCIVCDHYQSYALYNKDIERLYIISRKALGIPWTLPY